MTGAALATKVDVGAVTTVSTARGCGGGGATVDGGPGTAAVAPRGLSASNLAPLGLAVGEPVPDDRYHAIYFAMLLAGVGFLLPYNSFITDVDYLHHKYPGGSPAVVSRPPQAGRRAQLWPGALRRPRKRASASGKPILFRSSLGCRARSDSKRPLTLSGPPASLGWRKEAAPGEGGCRERGAP